jgi:phosphoserine phosphatase
MSHVVTIIASPERAGLNAGAAGRIADALRNAGAEPGAQSWLDDGIACDVALAPGKADIGALRAAAVAAADAEGLDAVVQDTAGRRKRLLIADMDATIVTGETLDELADHAGIKDRIAEITQRAMRGELDFRAALAERVGMLKGLPVAALADTMARVTLTPGAETLVATMRAHGAFAVLVSGGFEYFVSRIAARCGFDAHHSNRLEIAGEALTGGVLEPILDKDAKLAALRRSASERALTADETMVVRAEAPAVVTHGDLTALLHVQGYRRAEFAG